MPSVMLEVGMAAVAAGVAAVTSERFVRAALISAYCLVVTAARWSIAAFLVEDAAVSVSNWPSSSSISPGVSPLWLLAGIPGIMSWRHCAAAAVPNMSGASPEVAVSRSRSS